jgi:hypothetical protein
LYFGYKIIKKTKIRRWHEMDFVTGIPSVEETEVPEVPPEEYLGEDRFVYFLVGGRGFFDINYTLFCPAVYFYYKE